MVNETNKEVKYDALLKLNARKATPAPPVGTVLGPTGIDTHKFCEDFNEWSKNSEGVIETGIVVYKDLSYVILTKEQYLDFKRNEFSKVISASNLYAQFKDEEDKHFHR